MVNFTADVSATHLFGSRMFDIIKRCLKTGSTISGSKHFK
jgi:hypothetical protein